MMRFYQKIGNFIYEFNSFAQFIAFTLGRLLAIPLLLLLLVALYFVLHWLGYIESTDSFYEVLHLFI
jgi:hypothetical protein